MARKALEFLLSDDDRAQLRRGVRSGLMPYRSVTSSLTPRWVSMRLNVTASVIFKWRSRCLANGIDGREDLPCGVVGRG